MTEKRTEYVPYEVDVYTHEGRDFVNVDHDKFAKKAGMVYLAGYEEDEEGEQIESMMIPSENIVHIVERSEAEEVEVPEQPEPPTPQKGGQGPQQEEEDDEEEPEEESYHLPDLNVSQIRERIDNENNVDYLRACIEEDTRVTAVELYENRIEELQGE